MTESEWPSEIDVAWDTLAKIIKAALDKSCPKSKVKDTDFFISKKTSKLIKLKRQIRRIAQKTQDPIHKRLANQLKIIVAKAVKNDKDTRWRKNTKDLDEAKDSRMLWNTFNGISGKKFQTTNNNPVINSNGKSTENDKEKANAFAKTLGKIHNTHQGPIFNDKLKKEVDDAITSNHQLFNTLDLEKEEIGDDSPTMRERTIAEIKIQLSKTRGRSAPGTDGIRYPDLKQCPDIVFEYLEYIYNICLKIGYFPKVWEQATGIMIPKPDKDSKITTNYRPISLKGLAHAKIIKKSVILFRVLNMTI